MRVWRYRRRCTSSTKSPELPPGTRCEVERSALSAARRTGAGIPAFVLRQGICHEGIRGRAEQEEPSGEFGAAGLGCNHGPGLGRFARLRAAATCGAERDGAVVEGLKQRFNSGGGGGLV